MKLWFPIFSGMKQGNMYFRKKKYQIPWGATYLDNIQNVPMNVSEEMCGSMSYMDID